MEAIDRNKYNHVTRPVTRFMNGLLDQWDSLYVVGGLLVRGLCEYSVKKVLPLSMIGDVFKGLLELSAGGGNSEDKAKRETTVLLAWLSP